MRGLAKEAEMSKKLSKWLVLSAVTCVFLFLALGLNRLLKLLLDNQVISLAAVSILFFVVISVYFHYCYKLLFTRDTDSAMKIAGRKIETLPQYLNQLRDYAAENASTFRKQLGLITDDCRSFIDKKETVDKTLLSHFEKNSLSYTKFSQVLKSIEGSVQVTVSNILSRLKNFDEKEYDDILNKNPSPSKHLEQRQAIFDDYKSYLTHSADYLDEILVKMDQLQLEVSKVTSLSMDDIDNMEIIKEIDTMINNMKLYK